jgi:hypothetical protein
VRPFSVFLHAPSLFAGPVVNISSERWVRLSVR